METSQIDFSRVAIIGCPGSGKTVFSNKLGEILNRTVVHLDKILLGQNWDAKEFEQRVEIHNELIAQESWVIDGMWLSHLTERFKRATFVIFFDYKRSVCMWRAIKRQIKYNKKQRDDVADGCLDKMDKSFLDYIWTFKKKVRPQILQLIEENPQVQVVVLKNHKQTEQFIKALQQQYQQDVE